MSSFEVYNNDKMFVDTMYSEDQMYILDGAIIISHNEMLGKTRMRMVLD